MSASRGTAAEANDVAVRIFDTEVLRTPSGRGERSQDRDPAGSALRVERFDASDACRRIEMLGFIFGRFLQMQFQSVDTADGVEVVPRGFMATVIEGLLILPTCPLPLRSNASTHRHRSQRTLSGRSRDP